MKRKQPNNSKVGRLIDEYDLTGYGDQLVRLWQGEDGERKSLRELAAAFNRRILATKLAESNVQTIEGELENLYRLLTDDDVSTSARTEAQNRLVRNGIELDTLLEDFVSHQAIHTYLRRVREVEPPAKASETDNTIEKRRASIQRLRNRLVAVAERNINALRNAGDLSIGMFDVTVAVTVHCTECHSSFDITEFYDQRECNCNRS